VQVGDHRLHVMRSGSGPTVVFENGPGGIGLDWSLVVPEVAGFASTVAYDRAGLGWSEPTEGPRDIATLVDELKSMLGATGAEPPYVLVGHSYGGLIVRAFAYTYPEDVAGLVLVDAAHEDQFDFYPEEYAAKGQNMGQMMARLRFVFRLANGSGIPALLNVSAPIADKLPDEIGAARAAVGLMDSSQAVATTDEMAALLLSFDHVRSIREPLGDIPVRIITHGRAPGAEAGIPPGLEVEVEAAWHEMQRDLLNISADSRLEVASRSGHDIHVEQPEPVIDAIREILNG
jgi:pimeloyl-ACP methyl ester carboxylesterase